MEKVKIRKCESIMDGKAHAIELADGRKATAWCDKVDCELLALAYNAMDEIEVELKPYKSKVGKEGLNIVAINYIKGELTATQQQAFDAKQGNASANGQYQKPEITGTAPMIPKPLEFPKPEEFGESDITSINAKSSVKIKKNSKGIGWEIKVVSGEEDLMKGLIEHAIVGHKHMCVAFPAETETAG